MLTLAALVYSGEIELTLANGASINATNISLLTDYSAADLSKFRNYKEPKSFPLASAKALCELLHLPPTLIDNENQRDHAVQQIQTKLATHISEALSAKQMLNHMVWDAYIYSEAERSSLSTRLDELKVFLEGLQRYNTSAKLRNLTQSKTDIMGYATHLAAAQAISHLHEQTLKLGDTATYLSRAHDKLPLGNELRSKIQQLKHKVTQGLQNPAERDNTAQHQSWQQQMQGLKGEYIRAYLSLHTAGRLNHQQEEQRSKLLNSVLLTDLRTLRPVKALPLSSLDGLENDLAELHVCYALTERDLASSPNCTHCHFDPSVKQANATHTLNTIADALDQLYKDSTRTLLAELSDPSVKQSINALTQAQQKLLSDFAQSKALPQPVGSDFVAAVQEALRGIDAISITASTLHKGLEGLPCTVDEFRARFEEFVKQLTQGKEKERIRILIDESDGE